MSLWRQVAETIAREGRACLVRIVRTEGSTPREAGASIVLGAEGRFSGTIGGGALEHEALALGRRMLGEAPAGMVRRVLLGPVLGQCCGGAVEVRIDSFDAEDSGWIAPLVEAERAGPVVTIGREDAAGRLIRRLAGADVAGGVCETFGTPTTPVMIAGAGHVGRALVLALAPLPFSVRWVDSRAEAFPAHGPVNAVMEAPDTPLAALETAAPGTLLVVMTHSHALDLALVARALPDPRFAFVGLIGSATKRARFAGLLTRGGVAAEAVARLSCPVGGRAARDKHPAVIAAMIARDLLVARENDAARPVGIAAERARTTP